MSDNEIPQYIKAFTHLSDVLLTARRVGYDKHLDKPPGIAGSHQPGNLNRNRAAILFHDVNENSWVGGDWVGVSGTSQLHLPAQCGLKVLRPAEEGYVDVGEILGMPQSVCLEHAFKPADGHGLCSEVALINGLSHFLFATDNTIHGRDPARPCHLYLLTERLPCSSCTQLLGDFLRKFTGTVLHVGFMFDITSGGREINVYNFLKKMKVRTVAYKIQILSSKDTGHVAANGASQWRPAGVSSSAWDSSSYGEEVTHNLHIVPICRNASRRTTAPRTMPGRDPGQPSVHLSAGIAPGTGSVCREPRLLAGLLYILGIAGAGCALASIVTGRNRSHRPRLPHRKNPH